MKAFVRDESHAVLDSKCVGDVTSPVIFGDAPKTQGRFGDRQKLKIDDPVWRFCRIDDHHSLQSHFGNPVFLIIGNHNLAKLEIDDFLKIRARSSHHLT